MVSKLDFTLQPGQSLKQRFMTENISPRVSIITPFYNTLEHFEQMYNSVLNQTFPWFEWIIVDDGSTDQKALEQLERLAAQDQRITVYHVENGGPAMARNYGVEQATTDYIVFIDSDDMVEPVFLECLYLALQLNPKASWAYSDIVTIGVREFLWKKDFSSAMMKRENLLTVMAMIRRSAFDDVGGFDVMGRYYNEDWHMWLKLLSKGHFPVHIEQYLAWYRNGEKGAMSALDNDDSLVQKNQEKIREISEKVPDDIFAVTYHANKWKLFEDLAPWDFATPLPFAKKKKRILYIIPHIVMGGADKFNLDLISLSDPEEFEFVVVTTLNNQNEWIEKLEPFVSDLFVLPTMMDKRYWPEFFDYIIRTRQIDVVFNTNSYYAYYAMPWLHLQHPEVAFVDYIHMEEWYYRNGGFARPSGAIGMFLDKTYTCNSETGRVLCEHFHRSKDSVETVYIGVDEEKFSPDNASLADIPKEIRDTIAGRTTVLFPCRICAQKRPFLMLEIAKKAKDCVFLVVGDGGQSAELEQQIAKDNLSDRVWMVGRKSDLRPWYLLADVTLVCSLKEGLSLTAYESLAMGTPVITSDVGGQAELVCDKVGRVLPLMQDESKDEDKRDFAQEEIDQYVHAIYELTKDPAYYQQVASACRPHVQNGFTVNNMVTRMKEIFEELTTQESIAARVKKMEELKKVEPMTEALCDIWGSFEEMDATVQYFVGQYHMIMSNYQTAQASLDAIHKSRAHKVAFGYQKMVNESFLSNIRGFLGKIKRAVKKS